MTLQSMFTAEGMTLRDWFAGQVLAARLARPDTSPAAVENGAELAAWAYGVAKAMIVERERILAEEERALWDPEFAPPGPSTPQK